MGVLVAQVEKELFFVRNLAGRRIIAGEFEIEGAAAEPVVLRHGFDERGFGQSLGLCSSRKAARSASKSDCDSVGRMRKAPVEAMAGVVQSRDGLSGFAS